MLRAPVLALLLLSGLSSFVLAQPLASGAQQPEAEEADEKWVPTFHAIYETDPEMAKLSPERTSELVKQLGRELSQDKYLAVDNMAFALDKIKNLIDAGQISPEKCSDSSFKHLEDLQAVHEGVYWNVVAYLNDCRQRQFAVCKPELDAQLLSADEKLSEDEQMQLFYLTKSYHEAKQANPSNKIEALLDYMDSKVTPMSEFRNNKEEFLAAYKKSVEPLCRKVANHFEQPMKIYLNLAKHKEIVDNLDKFSTVCLDKMTVCHDTLTNMDNLISSNSRALISLINKPRFKSG